MTLYYSILIPSFQMIWSSTVTVDYRVRFIYYSYSQSFISVWIGDCCASIHAYYICFSIASLPFCCRYTGHHGNYCWINSRSSCCRCLHLCSCSFRVHLSWNCSRNSCCKYNGRSRRKPAVCRGSCCWSCCGASSVGWLIITTTTDLNSSCTGRHNHHYLQQHGFQCSTGGYAEPISQNIMISKTVWIQYIFLDFS